MFSYQQQSNLSKFFLLCLITLSGFFCFSTSIQAGNPTGYADYVTVHNPYNRLPVEGGTFISTGKYYSGYGNYTRHFRVFVPPGASLIDLRVVEATGNVAVARHNIRPLNDTLIPNDPTVQWRDRYSLSELEQKDCYVYHAGVDTIYILSDYLGGLSIDRAGWLYVNVGGGYVSDYFQIQWHVIIYPSEVPIYNYWWDNYGSNPDGSISWEKDVESVYQYHAKLKGDLDDDDDVDANDYSIFQINYKNTDSNNIANLDGRSPVDANDYAILQKNYTGSK